MRKPAGFAALMLGTVLCASEAGSQWQGWWRQRLPEKGFDNDVLLLTPGKLSGSLRVSGKAYWYGQMSEHLGEVNGEATPDGSHLHLVETDAKGRPDGCVLDLTLTSASGESTIKADDNNKCGANNVTFRGVWHRFTPAVKKPAPSALSQNR